MKSIILGILASLFFAVTFVLNKWMSVDGGSWIWSASLRYIFMLPILIAIVLFRKSWRGLIQEMRCHPWQWLVWSFVGFGLFYAPLCFAAAYSPAWLVAGTWQFTIIAGSLLAPLFKVQIPGQPGQMVRQRIPFKSMGMSLIILAGIIVLEVAQATHVSTKDLLLGILPILIATFAYPLGNRKMMALSGGRLDAYQRTLGMTVASLPLWIVISIIQLGLSGPPSENQTLQSLVVAMSSGVVATVLFFTATDLAQHHMNQLATVEATQAGEVVFTLIGERLLIAGTKIPLSGFIGLSLVVTGMVLHSLMSVKRKSAHRTRSPKKKGQTPSM